MIIGVIGSRDLIVNELEKYIPSKCTKIVSGGAVGIDVCAAKYAQTSGIELSEILPDYKKHGKAAPIVRNKTIVEASNKVIAFWNGHSKGTKMVIDYCKKINKTCTVIKIPDDKIKNNVDDLSVDDLNTVMKRAFVLNDLTKVYAKEKYEIVANAPDIFSTVQDKLKRFSDRKKGKFEAEISIESLSAYVKIVLPILLLSKEDVDLLNDMQEQLSELMVTSCHNEVVISAFVPYFVDK